MNRKTAFFLPVFFVLFTASDASFGQEKLDLRPHWVKDDVHSIIITLDQTIDQTVHGKAERLTQRMTTGCTIKVDDVDDRGQATLSLRYDSQAFHFISGSTTIDYDSTQPGTVEPAVAAPLAVLIGQTVVFTVSPEGQVTRVTGIEKLANQVVNKLSGVEGPARVAVERTLRSQLSEPSLKITLQNLFAPFPDHAVAVGESWPHTTRINTGIPVSLETTCTLKSRENGTATIEVSGHFSTPPNSTLELGQTKFLCEFQGDTQGQIQVQESTGWIVNSTTTQSLAGTATTQSQTIPAQAVPLKVESTMKASTK